MTNGNSRTEAKIVSALVILGLGILVTLGFFHPITALTQDLGRHLLTGNLILQTGHVPETNLFSYVSPDFPYISTHWLSQVFFALVHSAFGFVGLFILMLLLLYGACGMQILAIRKHISVTALSLCGILSLGILLERTDLRPELFSFFLLSVYTTILYRNRETPSRLIFILIPLQLLWVNLHIYFAIGLVILGLFWAEMLFLKRKSVTTRPVYELSLVFLLSVLVSLLNPHGLQGLLYPLHVFQNYGYTIEENQTVFFLQSLGFHKPSFPYLFLYVILFFTSLAVTYKKTRPIDWLLAVVFTYLAFSAVRNLPLLVFATFIPFYMAGNQTLTKLTASFHSVELPIKKNYLVWVSIGILFLWQGYLISQKTPLGYGVAPGASQAVMFFQENKLSGPIFNNFDIGGYLIYRLYPEERVFVDGRPEAYPASFFQKEYIPMQENPELFKKLADKYQFQTIIFPHTDQTPWGMTFLKWIIRDPAWKLIYADDYAVILVRNTPENQNLISRYGMDLTHLRLHLSENTFEANLRMAAFLAKVELVDQSLPYTLALLERKPDYCPALGIVADIYQKQNNPAAFIYGQRYTQTCF